MSISIEYDQKKAFDVCWKVLLCLFKMLITIAAVVVAIMLAGDPVKWFFSHYKELFPTWIIDNWYPESQVGIFKKGMVCLVLACGALASMCAYIGLWYVAIELLWWKERRKELIQDIVTLIRND